ncbi:MAG: hypothetical protein DCC49_12750 [Acidobacteria bacterium]|nr:MAG: hypothetical protein DCC49_12750 [Acidobacteriota bacterium]
MGASGRSGVSAKRRRVSLTSAVAIGVLTTGLVTYLVLRGPSPSRVVSAYMVGIERGDYETAFGELSESAKRSVGDAAGLRQTAIAATFTTGVADAYEIGPTRDEAGRTSVEVRLTKGATETVVRLAVVREGGRWRVEV